MKTMSVQEVHEHWQETIASLVSEGEILITSDNHEVAVLVAKGGGSLKKAIDLDEAAAELDHSNELNAAVLANWRDEVFSAETIDTLSALTAERGNQNPISPSSGQALADWRKDFAAGRIFDTTSSLTLDRDSRSNR